MIGLTYMGMFLSISLFAGFWLFCAFLDGKDAKIRDARIEKFKTEFPEAYESIQDIL